MKAEKIDTVSIKMPRFMVKELDKLAKNQDRSRSSLVRNVLQEWIKNKKNTKK